jgi:predicted nucleotidyltransferase/HEPN domain-containing protein
MDTVLSKGFDGAVAVNEGLDHLPDRKRRELARAVKILFDEFEEAQKGKLSDRKKAGRILKVILFGSYARGDWVEDNKSGYHSDYDLLVVVNAHVFTDEHEFWGLAAEHLRRDLTHTHHIATPVSFIVHDYMDVNNQLARGRPFFVDICRDGVVLYEEPGHPLVSPKPLTPEEAVVEGRAHFDQWFKLSSEALEVALYSIGKGIWRDGSFMLHQATERAYHCILLTLSLYSPKSHRLKDLRARAEDIEPRLVGAWPRDTKFSRRSFERLDRAYVEARYSARFSVTPEELSWLTERVANLQALVKTVCLERLD